MLDMLCELHSEDQDIRAAAVLTRLRVDVSVDFEHVVVGDHREVCIDMMMYNVQRGFTVWARSKGGGSQNMKHDEEGSKPRS
jgi:hypothetical protein